MTTVKICYWNIENLTNMRADVVKNQVIPWVDKFDVTFIMEGLQDSQGVVDGWLKIHEANYGVTKNKLKGLAVDADDPSGRKEKYLVFWNELTIKNTSVALQQYDVYTDKRPYGRAPVVLSCSVIKVAAWHAPGPGKDSENPAAAYAHANVLEKGGVHIFGGDMNYNPVGGKLGKYTVALNARETTLGKNWYDFVGVREGCKAEMDRDFSPGISDHRGISLKAYV